MRFPEFSGEWETSSIAECFSLYSGNTPSRTQKENFVGELNWISSGELKTHYLEHTGEHISVKVAVENNLRILPVGTFVIAIYGLEAEGVRGTGSIITKESTISQACMAFLPKGPITSEFIYAWYKKHGNLIGIKYAQGTKQQNLGYDIVEKLQLRFPSIAEQKKLEQFISLIDERIETQRKIIEDLKKLKNAIAEKLFCGPDDESPELCVVNSSDKWNLYHLKEVCQRISERNSHGLSSLVLTIAAQYGLVSQTDFFNKSVASENLSNYHLIQKGDFAYNKSYSGEYAWGAVKRLDLYEKGLLSPLYICFRPNPLIVDSDFLSHYFETHKWHNGIAQIAGEGARNHGLLNVSITDYFATLHRFPGLSEQKKIASYLNSLSDKISLASKELECYLRQKRYMLARMFI